MNYTKEGVEVVDFVPTTRRWYDRGRSEIPRVSGFGYAGLPDSIRWIEAWYRNSRDAGDGDACRHPNGFHN